MQTITGQFLHDTSQIEYENIINNAVEINT